jgi:DNA-binding transcriptional ArsR family regulator
MAMKKKKVKEAKKGLEILDPRLAKALANSLRVEILAVLSHRRISPVEFSREYGGHLSRISYHFKVLEEYECIELAEKVQRRGAVEHIYRSVTRPLLGDSDWTQLPKAVQGGVSGAILQTLVARATRAIEEGRFDAREDRHFTWTPLSVDEQGWRELISILESALEQVNAVEVKSSKRMAKGGEKGIPATVALAGFESPTEDPA